MEAGDADVKSGAVSGVFVVNYEGPSDRTRMERPTRRWEIAYGHAESHHIGSSRLEGRCEMKFVWLKLVFIKACGMIPLMRGCFMTIFFAQLGR